MTILILLPLIAKKSFAFRIGIARASGKDENKKS